MTITIEIPDSKIIDKKSIEKRLWTKLAIQFYMEGHFTKGQAKDFAGLDQLEFQDALAEAGGFLRISQEDFRADMANLDNIIKALETQK